MLGCANMAAGVLAVLLGGAACAVGINYPISIAVVSFGIFATLLKIYGPWQFQLPESTPPIPAAIGVTVPKEGDWDYHTRGQTFLIGIVYSSIIAGLAMLIGSGCGIYPPTTGVIVFCNLMILVCLCLPAPKSSSSEHSKRGSILLTRAFISSLLGIEVATIAQNYLGEGAWSFGLCVFVVGFLLSLLGEVEGFMGPASRTFAVSLLVALGLAWLGVIAIDSYHRWSFMREKPVPKGIATLDQILQGNYFDDSVRRTNQSH